MASRRSLILALIALVIALVIALAGCAGQDKPTEAVATTPTPPSPAVHSAPSSEITAIRLQRSACYGMCPIYEVELTADGQVKYVGDKFVAQVGSHTSKIQPSAFEALAAQIGAIHFFDLKSRYRSEPDGCTSSVTDQPTATIIVTANGTDKAVSYYYGCRGLTIGPQLKALAQTIDTVGGTSQWVRGGSSAP